MLSNIRLKLKRNIRSLGVAELCPFDFNCPIALQGCLSYFRPNMLPFPITIRPNEQGSSIFGLACNVGRDGPLVLELLSHDWSVNAFDVPRLLRP